MDEANPATPDAAPSAPDLSFDDRLAAKLGFAPDEAQPEQAEAREETSPPADGELSPEEVAVDDPAPSEDWLELDRKGEKRRISKEEAKRLAQQGWDYSTQVERLKAEEATINQMKAAVEQNAKITPQVVEAAANVRFYERALEQYKGINWAQKALELDPQQYAQHRATFDQLRDGYGQAVQGLQTVLQQAHTVSQQIDAAELEKQRTKLLDAVPSWRDPQKFNADAGRIRQYLLDTGMSEAEIARITDSRVVLIAYNAMRYDQAVKARGQRESKQGQPALKPGAAPARPDAKAQLADQVKQLHQAKDPERKKALLDAVLEKKLARFIPS